MFLPSALLFGRARAHVDLYRPYLISCDFVNARSYNNERTHKRGCRLRQTRGDQMSQTSAENNTSDLRIYCIVLLPGETNLLNTVRQDFFATESDLNFVPFPFLPFLHFPSLLFSSPLSPVPSLTETYIIWPCGTVVRGGLMFYCWCFFSFFLLFQREISELRQPIAAKLCHVIRRFFRFYARQQELL